MTGFTAESTLTADGGRAQLHLATALGCTPEGLVDHPSFFSGLLARPDVAAAGLLTVADVAMARYADAGFAKRLAADMDPLVTAGGDRLRFESFSACNGVYARFDLLADGVDDGQIGFGTTNVDINQSLRTALARVGRADLLHLSVGDSALTVSSLDETYVEGKVALPDRWVRGCAEVPALAARMQPVATLNDAAITRFLGDLPSVAPPGPVLYLVDIGSALRTTPHPVPGSTVVTGTSRLRASARISRFATTLTVYAGPHGTSGWVFEVPDGRLTLLLSPGPYRGFSGEGGLLTLLADRDAESHGRTLLHHLDWNPSIDPARLGSDADLPAAAVSAGLAWLAACGRVGYDLTEQAYFHRDLPVDAELVLRRSPRLVAARRLLERGAVTRDGSDWLVRGDHDHYRVRDQRCSCPWEREHEDSRGPCKHRLAVAMAQGAP